MYSVEVLSAVHLPPSHRRRAEYVQFRALAEDARPLSVVEVYIDAATNEVSSLAVEWVRGLWHVGKDRSSVRATTVQMTKVSKATESIFLKENFSRSMVLDHAVEHGAHQYHSDQVSSTSVGRVNVRPDGYHVGPQPIDWLILAVVRIAYALVLGPLGKFPDVEPKPYSPDLSRLTLAASWVPFAALQRSAYDVLDAQKDVESVSGQDSSNIRQGGLLQKGVEPFGLDVLWDYGSGPLPPNAGQAPGFALRISQVVGIMEVEAEDLSNVDLTDL